MHEVVGVVALVAIVVALQAVAKRLGLLAPIVLVVVGIVISYIPGFLEIKLDPELVMFGILPPLFYVAALETSVPAFRNNLRPILLLAIGLVVFTMVGVGFALHAALAVVPLTAAFVLGAVVAPTDAVSATAIGRRLGMPRRMVTILEGESLINDATALVGVSVTVSVVVGAAVTPVGIAWTTLRIAGGGLLVGAIAALTIAWLHRHVHHPLIDNSISVLTPFVVYLFAEWIGASGVVAVVICGLYVGHRLPTLMSAGSRLQTTAFWQMVKFILEGSLFLLVGLQIRDIIRSVNMPAHQVVIATITVVLAVIIGRMVWVFGATYLARLVPRVRERDPLPPVSVPTVLGWAGMRGVVSLAAAFGIPALTDSGDPFPYRNLLIWLTFAVIVATLVFQGLTLSTLIRAVRLPRDDERADVLVEAEVQHDASAAAQARLDRMQADGAQIPPSVVDQLRQVTDLRANRAWERLWDAEDDPPSQMYIRIRRELIETEREVFRTARDEGRIPEDALDRALRSLDLEESMLQPG